jgi:hypothetical protein
MERENANKLLDEYQRLQIGKLMTRILITKEFRNYFSNSRTR